MLVGPSGDLVVRGKSSKSTRWCGVELDKGNKSFVVRKGGATGTIERRVLISSIEQVLEVNQQGQAGFMLMGNAGPGVGPFQLSFTSKQPEELFRWVEGMRSIVEADQAAAAAAAAAAAPASAPAADAKPAKPPAPFATGERVEVFGLESEMGKAMNGMRGVVVGWLVGTNGCREG